MKYTNEAHEKFLLEAIELSEKSVKDGAGGPFGCVVVKDDKIIARAYNQVTENCDPTAHAEVQAIRKACQHLNNFQLQGCIIYTSCEPCPMCLGAIYWARPAAVYFANTKQQAANAGFDDGMIYSEIEKLPEDRIIPMCHVTVGGADNAFELWKKSTKKKAY